MLDEIQEVSWCDVVEFLCALGQSLVQLNDSVVNSDDGMNDNLVTSFVFLDFNLERFHYRVNDHGKFFGNLDQSFFRPVSKPVDDTSVEQGRRWCCSVGEIWIVGIHGEYDVEVSLDISDESLVNLVVWWAAFGVAFLELGQQKHVLFTLEETRNLTWGKESVHLFQEGGRETVGLIEDETDLFLLDTSTFHDGSEILIKISHSIISSSLDLEHRDIIHPRHKPTQGSLTDTTGTNQQTMSQGLS